MCIRLFTHGISELNGEAVLKELSIAELKKMVEILVIDDNEFTFLQALQKYEFNIKQKNDLTLLSDAEAFGIILCDIRGVGKFLESKYDGANLIKELKVKYPNKIIVAYTANDYDAEFQRYISFADEVVPKGSYEIENWVALLEKLLRESADPIKQWERTRKALFDAGVSTVDVAKYESQYVKAIKNGSFDSFKKLYGSKKTSGSNIMIDLLSSTIAKVIKP